MDPQLVENAKKLAEQAQELAVASQEFAARMADMAAEQGGHGNFVGFLSVFVLACFVGYYVVWRVTPALHSPLMAVTNAISSVIIVGALLAAGSQEWGASKLFGFIAVTLASVNIFGGFIVTERMLSMFKKKEAKK